TPRYLAREQILGEPDARSDIYSLGAILWWALTGREHLHDVEEVGRVLDLQLRAERAPNPLDHRPDLPQAVGHLLQRLMDPDPGRRLDADGFLDRWPLAVRATTRRIHR